ncbi:hypothetical protein ABZ912_23325 [Nonomuraea angiospora]|uniref:hypothetical protein n=1 Tax=Nonomuraea angiospora TaxID=46172 RepID=UPI003405D3E3
MTTRPWASDADPSQRARWYSDAELSAVRVVKTDSEDGAYWVVAAGGHRGPGHTGWPARRRSGTPITRTGTHSRRRRRRAGRRRRRLRQSRRTARRLRDPAGPRPWEGRFTADLNVR